MKKVQRKKMEAENAAAKKSSARCPAANNCSEDDDHDVPLAKAFAADDTNKRAASQVPSEKDPASKASPDAEPAQERSAADAELKNGQSDEQPSEEAVPALKGKLRRNGKTAKKSPVSPKKRKASTAKSETDNEDSSSPSKKSKKSNKKESKPVEEEFEVQSIVGHKKEGGVSYYLVRWKGYTAADDTWEPEQDLSCPDLVEKYKRNAGSPANGKGGGKKAATASPKGAAKKASLKTPKKVDPNKEWEVEKIIDYSLDKGERLFRIRWKGYAAKHDTWEPERNLNCAEIIKKFMDRMDAQDNVSVKELREEPKKVKRLVNEMPRQYRSSASERKSKRSVAKQRIYYGDSD